MGMFDYFNIDSSFLPEELKDHSTGWQTKSLDCNMDNISLDKFGKLCKTNFNDEEDLDTYGDSIPLSYTGEIHFYNSINGVWLEFVALFNNGVFISMAQRKNGVRVNIEARELRAQWTPELAQDLEALNTLTSPKITGEAHFQFGDDESIKFCDIVDYGKLTINLEQSKPTNINSEDSVFAIKPTFQQETNSITFQDNNGKIFKLFIKNVGNKVEVKMTLRNAVKAYICLPSHRKADIWHELGCDLKFTFDKSSDVNFSKWMKDNDKEQEFIDLISKIN